jgi:hypothetical protein
MNITRVLLTAIFLLVFYGCEYPPPPGSSAPPSFLDPAPSRPTSETVIWAGLNVLSAPPVSDFVVVVQNNEITTWGVRGYVKVPNDSMGLDMRRYWIGKQSKNQLVNLSKNQDGTLDLSSFIVVEGQALGQPPSKANPEIIAEVEDFKLLFLTPPDELGD